MDASTLFEIVDQIDHSLRRIPLHIGGGEPLIHFQLVKDLISYLKGTKIILEYLETNAASLISRTSAKLEELKASGLDCMLISISPFHNEFIPVRQTKRIMHEIVSILGPQGIFPWHPGYLTDLERVSENEAVPLETYFDAFSPSDILRQLTSVMYIHPGGRGAYLLARYLPRHPAEDLLDKRCTQNLGSPVHAHIDFKGNYLTGFCSGLRIGKQSGRNLSQLYAEGIDLDHYPVLDQLINRGLKGLYETAVKSGFAPEPRGYVSPCHLCLDLRLHVYFHVNPYEELYPSFFYDDLRQLKRTVLA